METVLLTGATGYLGGYVISELKEHDYNIIAIGRNKKRGQELESLGCKFYQTDFADEARMRDIFNENKIDYVIHTGALSSAWGAYDDFYHCNVEGTEIIAGLCMENDVKRMVYISSPSVYCAKRDRLDIKEDEVDESNEMNYYIKTKIISEQRLRGLVEKGLKVTILRPRALIGKGDPSLMPRLMRANKKIGIPLFNKGKNYVDVTCVENVAYACLLAMKKDVASGSVYNITNGEPHEFKEILEKFCVAASQKPKFLALPFPLIYGVASMLEWMNKTFHMKSEPVLTKYTVCTLAFSQTLCLDRARNELGYEPKLSLEEGVKNYGIWWSKNSGN